MYCTCVVFVFCLEFQTAPYEPTFSVTDDYTVQIGASNVIELNMTIPYATAHVTIDVFGSLDFP